MTSNYRKNGVDLDGIFAPWHAGWPQASATHLEVAGTDFDTRYAPLSTGSAVSATGFRINSVDAATIFAGIGTTNVQVSVQPGNASGSASAGRPSGTVTSNAVTCAGTKGGGSYTYTWICSGCTANSPNSPTTTFSAVVNAASTTNASAYCNIADGVTSANTNTISVTLQNTSTATVIRTYTSPAGNYLTETVPSGYSTCVIEAWGGGGAGAASVSGPAGGGGGGGYVTTTIAVTGGDHFTYYIGNESTTTAPTNSGNNGLGSTVSGSVSGGSVNIGATPGAGGTLSAGGRGNGGAGGTVISGSAGTFGSPGIGGSGGNGGAGGGSNGAYGALPSGGGAAGYGGTYGGAGAQGQIRFTYT